MPVAKRADNPLADRGLSKTSYDQPMVLTEAMKQAMKQAVERVAELEAEMRVLKKESAKRDKESL